MDSYRVSFYKHLLNSDGHSFKCLQRSVDVQSDGPSQALVQAERLVDNERLNADCVEVMHLAGSQPEFGRPSSHSPAPINHTRNRVAP
ncbi:hypothetical protein GWE18_24775 [Bradyrhizobium sp. CSA112]|uniref:hypothetical protein n=1 Tax=Bradyrhizobium sp. CSA112 TaxID=2699170 RepID=UPI0023B1F124|nr:hypothetical protein [Bradyrhizobium sp. CSA112]MDE5455988.1 hypothetical protein [Bradyrhizobium sp. CSA112]